MVEFIPVSLPQLGANDTSATLLEWSKPKGGFVNKAELICTAETTKSVFDIESPATGYLMDITPAGSEVQVGQIIAVITTELVSPEEVNQWVSTQESTLLQPKDRKDWTYKAEILAHRHGLDLTKIPTLRGKITEADVLAYIETQNNRDEQSELLHDLMDDQYPSGRAQRLLIIGGGMGAIQVLDILSKVSHQRAVAVMDDNSALHGKRLSGVPIIGNIQVDRALDMFQHGQFDAAVISISTNIDFRAQVFEEWKKYEIPFANIIHPSAIVGTNVSWGEGNIVMAFCHIGACAGIGHNNFLSAYCSIEHHSILGNHCSFGPGVITSSRVTIGDRVRFGTGIFVEPYLTIGAETIIGSGSVIWQNIPEQSILKSKLNYTMRPRRKGT